MSNKIKLSILDQSPIRLGDTAHQALMESTASAKLTDELGYTRYWVSEHHNSDSIAGSAPEILIAHLANHTERMRIGSGGIMLPNHSALKMADNFRLLEALFPNRIDMGIGRAPGTDRLTASLLNPNNTFNPQEFIDQLQDLDMFLHGANDKGSVFEKVKSTPNVPTVAQRWMLTSSGDSAFFAAEMGLPVSFAYFINPHPAMAEVMREYRYRFIPSADYPEPMANVSVFAFCSEDKEKNERQRKVMDYRFLQFEKPNGNLSAINFDSIKDEKYSAYDEQRISVNQRRYMIGTPAELEPRIRRLADNYGVDEIMLCTYSESFDDKMEAHRLFAKMFL